MLQHTYHVSTEQTHGAAEVEVLSVRPSACGLGTTPDIVRETTSNTLTITVTGVLHH